MWKTYAEYKHLFRDWKKNELNLVFDFFENNKRPAANFKYFVLSGNVEKSEQKEKLYNELNSKYGIDRLIFVGQKIRATSLNPYETFFVFKDDALRISDIDLFNRTKIEDNFFYFYYKTKDNKPLEKDQISELINKLHLLIKVNLAKYLVFIGQNPVVSSDTPSDKP
jgi:hypothetical protein